ncbi:hypothetical protein E1292_14555 [Nonomuraea deserti]|uniref:DUF4440 domain-containing protein n=1 Tax=Nonomuraea deserti TaxID=1848322 RepID=A0A4R4VNU7_9ACTN|nr:hypothetical protein [Nonomuraea deserti]TDD06781.1 hypothetical protein E1292_14555 [Nonomuraea deserti]
MPCRWTRSTRSRARRPSTTPRGSTASSCPGRRRWAGCRRRTSPRAWSGRALLATAHLDRKTLLGDDPAALVKLLHREQREWFTHKGPGKRRAARSLVDSFAPKAAELATGAIKVQGEAALGTYEEDGWRGADVKLSHLIVYAVHRPGQPATEDAPSGDGGVRRRSPRDSA